MVFQKTKNPVNHKINRVLVLIDTLKSRGGRMPRIFTNDWFSVFWICLLKAIPFMDTWL